jgi:hypothetical protein
VATYIPPKRAVALDFWVGLVSQADTKLLQTNPTLAAGDVKVSKDGGALANLTTLPTVTPAAGKLVKVSLSATEMTADNVTVIFSDAAGAEWCDLVVNVQTAARQIDDLTFPNTSGRGMDVDAAGGVEVGSFQAGAIGAAAFAAGAIDAAAIAANAIGASELAADAVTEIQAGLSTLTAAQVNAEVVDALNVDTYAEPGQEAPPATTTLVRKIGYLYKLLRNRVTQTSTTFKVYADDATTVDQKATVSDDGTTFDRGEIAAGP